MMRLLILLTLLTPILSVAQNKVGIGTPIPLSKLDISAQGEGVELLRLSTERPWVFKQHFTGVNTRLALQTTTNDKWFEILSADGMNRAAEFYSNNTYSRVSLVPDAGEVAIGLDDALSKLHVMTNSTTAFPQLRLTEQGFDYARIKLENDARPAAFWDIAGLADTITSNSKLNFYYASPNGSGDRMTITGEGNVGVGTTNPQAKVDIIGGDWNLGAGNPGDLRIGNSTYNFRVGVATGGGGAGTVRLYSQGGGLMLGTSNTTRLTIANDGNVGIGTESPGNKLRVTGSPTSTQHVLSAGTTYSGNVDIRAVEGFSTPSSGFGYGGYFVGGYIGMYSRAQGGSYNGSVYGVYGVADGSAGTRTALYGSASGGATNWAGYFNSGNVYIANDLRIGSGASGGATGYKVAIDGKVIAEEMRVQLSDAWPDYVFDPHYDLSTIDDLKHYVTTHKHLPGVPSATEVEGEGILLGEMQRILLEKVEELSLHIIELNERIATLEGRTDNTH